MNEHEFRALEAKLRQLADNLTPAEQEQVRTIQTDDVAGMLSPALLDKAQQTAGTLTPEETAQLSLLLEHAGLASVMGDGADTQGFEMAEYEDNDAGSKGRPGTSSRYQGGSSSGSGLLGPAILLGLGFVFGGANLPGNVPGEYP
jgi:hypothetical protein